MHLVGDHFFFWSHFSGHLDIKLHACMHSTAKTKKLPFFPLESYFYQ